MPKMKTHSSAKKRFKVTGTGKVMFFRSGRRHLLRKKSNKAKTRLLKPGILQPGDAKRIKLMLCM